MVLCVAESNLTGGRSAEKALQAMLHTDQPDKKENIGDVYGLNYDSFVSVVAGNDYADQHGDDIGDDIDDPAFRCGDSGVVVGSVIMFRQPQRHPDKPVKIINRNKDESDCFPRRGFRFGDGDLFPQFIDPNAEKNEKHGVQQDTYRCKRRNECRQQGNEYGYA